MLRRLTPALLAACAPPAAEPPCTTCALADANNFAWTADLAVDVLPARALTDVTLRWPALTRDLQGHALDPLADVAQAKLVAFRDLSPAEVAEGLAADTVFQSDVTLYVVCEPSDAACRLSDFGILGSAVDVSAYFEEGAATWLLALARPGEPGAAALAFLDPRADGDTTVSLTDDTGRLAVEVDLRSLAPVRVPADDPALLLAWDGLTVDGRGNPLALGSVDGVSVARYDAPLAELEEHVFDLLTRTDDVWSAPTSGRSVDLSTLAGPRPFPGIDADGTWLFALTCSSCTNPTPRFVTVLVGAS